jgi:hypothetical protein
MIIDCHCHAGQGSRLTAPWNTVAPLQAYLRRARRAGIAHTIVFSAFHTDYFEANRLVARAREIIGEAVRRYGFRGIKVHGHQHLPTRELCEVAREFGLPVLADVVGKAHVIDMFAPEYPDVNFIIPHLGSFADDWRAHERVVEQLVRYPNVYTDTSGVRRFDYLVRAVKRAGPGKILFGSDGPWLHPGLELEKVRLLGLSGNDEALILGGNVQRLVWGKRMRNHRRRPTRPTFARWAGGRRRKSTMQPPVNLDSRRQGTTIS